MPRRRFRSVALGVVALLSVLAVPSSAWAGGPGVWTKLATVDNGGDTFGIARTPNGDLHLVWLKKRASNNTLAYGTSTISLAGKLLTTGTALSGWQSLETDPQLVPDGSGLRLIFEGNTGTAGCYIDGSVFTETSATGSTWNLVHGSLSQATVGVGNLAATAESNGTPVATFAAGHLFHVGVDPNCPAKTPDGTITPTPGSAQGNPSIVTDPHDGSVWVAWFQSFEKQAYWVEQILPTQGPPIEAPASATHITPFENNQPDEPVALSARQGGGVYMAYCVASSSQPCAHIDLWKVGSPSARVVPDSQNTTGARVALAAAPGGRLAIAWYNEAKNVIHTVRTNTATTSFGVVRTIKTPAGTIDFTDIQAQDSTGRLDIVVTEQLNTTNFPIDLFHTQILPGLALHANPTSFSHKKAATVTFTATDAGQPVAGAKVSCLAKHGSTTTVGEVKLNFSKGAPVGKHACTASKPGYAAGETTIKVT
jgi:hypothetical protein